MDWQEKDHTPRQGCRGCLRQLTRRFYKLDGGVVLFLAAFLILGLIGEKTLGVETYKATHIRETVTELETVTEADAETELETETVT
ncbi:MAG: hypothetical protein Q4C70_15335, partial [Planctomycetia bacterium]|nr:hypothetical protein [Planctomycetia bacterium]